MTLKEKYTAAVEASLAIANGVDSKEEYEKYKSSILEYYYSIHDAVIASFMRTPELLLIANALLEIKTEFKTNMESPINIILERHKGFTLQINPLYISDYTFNELRGVYIQEISRIILDHPLQYKKLNNDGSARAHMFLEKSSATDVSEILRTDIINSYKDTKIKQPPHVYTKSMLEQDCGGAYYNSEKTINKYFDFLTNKYVDKPGNGGGGTSAENGNGTSTTSTLATEVAERENNTNAQGISDAIKKFEDDILETSDMHNFDKQEKSECQQQTRAFVDMVTKNMSEKERGNIPGIFKQKIDGMLNKKSAIRWQNDLKSGLGLIPADYTFSRRKQHRTQPHRFDLCGTVYNYHVEVVVCIDTSGSMSDKEIYDSLVEVYNICKQYKTIITVIECDSSIGRVYEVKKVSDIKKEVTGRGGTYFTPAIKYINEHPRYRKAIMIYFTDGYGEYNIPKPETLKNIWVVTNTDCDEQAARVLSVKNPYGVVRSLKPRKD